MPHLRWRCLASRCTSGEGAAERASERVRLRERRSPAESAPGRHTPAPEAASAERPLTTSAGSAAAMRNLRGTQDQNQDQTFK